MRDFYVPPNSSKVQYPLVFWGDHGFTEQGGMYSHKTFLIHSKDRYEHASWI